MNINKVMLYGNLTRDPEHKVLPNGGAVANFAMATNRKYKKNDGTYADEVEFHNIVAYGKVADLIAQWLRKGSGAYIEGRLKTRSWDDTATGAKRYMTEIIVDQVQFGPKRDSSTSQDARGGGQDELDAAFPTTPAKRAPAASVASGEIEYPADCNPDDIPF